jgi:hypothetical protein
MGHAKVDTTSIISGSKSPHYSARNEASGVAVRSTIGTCEINSAVERCGHHDSVYLQKADITSA